VLITATEGGVGCCIQLPARPHLAGVTVQTRGLLPPLASLSAQLPFFFITTLVHAAE
jgi:hypothetical protein